MCYEIGEQSILAFRQIYDIAQLMPMRNALWWMAHDRMVGTLANEVGVEAH